jgi:hypothetical protein
VLRGISAEIVRLRDGSQLSQELEVGVKWKTNLGSRVSTPTRPAPTKCPSSVGQITGITKAVPVAVIRCSGFHIGHSSRESSVWDAEL